MNNVYDVMLLGDGIEGLDNSERWEVVGSEWAGGGRGTLAAAAAARAQAGRYRCRADNGVGAPLLKHVNVSIHGALTRYTHIQPLI